MTRWLWIFVVAVALPAAGEEMTVPYQKTVELSVPGAIAAYSLNSALVEAKVENEILFLHGKVPGATSVVVILGQGTRTFNVRIPEPPLRLPPDLARTAELGNAYGSYEMRFSSEPSQWQNIVDFYRQDGDRTLRLHIASSALFTSVPGQSFFSLPSAFYQITTPNREITLGDLSIMNSQLSVYGPTIRGIHLRQGPVTFHAGYTSISEFQNVLLPATREMVLGASWRHQFSKATALTFNAFYFSHPSDSTLSPAVRSGPVGSLVYEYKPREGLNLEAEAGISNGVFGGALLFRFQRPGEQLYARLRYQPKEFAAIASQYRSGVYSDVNWARQLTPKLRTSVRFTANQYSLVNYEQTNLYSDTQAQYKLNRNWSVLGGFTYAHYAPHRPPQASISSLGVPVGLSFDSRRFGASFQYRYSTISGSERGSQEFRVAARTNWNRLNISAFLDRQTQAPTVSLVFRELPGLAEALAQAGLTAGSPEELARLLEQNPALAGLGYIQGVNFFLSPVRLQAGGNVSWMSRGTGRHQVTYSFLYSRNETISSSYLTTLHTVNYALRINRNNDLYTSFSLLRSSLPGLPADYQPLVAFSLRHTFSGVPNFLLPARTGTIAGTVFLDPDSLGRLEDQPGLEGVEVVLDGARRTRTDGHGRYAFSHIPPGLHTVEALYRSDRPFFFTTESNVTTSINNAVDFGIAASLAPLAGLVRSDAGLGIAGVGVNVSCQGKKFSVETDGEGRFHMQGLPPGTCEVSIDPDSAPIGYELDGQRAVQVVAQAETPARPEIVLKTLRSVAGKILTYDPAAGRQMPVTGAVVRIAELKVESVSDSQGAFLFRSLPPGEYQVSVEHLGQKLSRTLAVPKTPLQRVDFNVELAPQ